MSNLPKTRIGDAETEPLINQNSVLQDYYASIESRVGYRLFLGGARHFGYYEEGTWWPFPISKGLRAMEHVLMKALDLPPGAEVLDAGCGYGQVAMYMAEHGKLNVTGIDVVERHVARARKNIERAGLQNQIVAKRMDYHHLESISDASFDGIYTNETLVHATDPELVVSSFIQKLRPGGHIAIHEYEHIDYNTAGAPMNDSALFIDEHSAMPTNTRAFFGFWKRLLEEAGFVDVKVRDLSANARPLLLVFYLVALIPYYVIKFLGIEKYFTNTIAGYWAYIGIGTHWKILQVTGRKPGGPLEVAKAK